ncbi:MAG: hypothetical protein ACR2LN_01580 [Candidatus Levyibacteriota bacterium]
MIHKIPPIGPSVFKMPSVYSDAALHPTAAALAERGRRAKTDEGDSIKKPSLPSTMDIYSRPNS